MSYKIQLFMFLNIISISNLIWTIIKNKSSLIILPPIIHYYNYSIIIYNTKYNHLLYVFIIINTITIVSTTLTLNIVSKSNSKYSLKYIVGIIDSNNNVNFLKYLL